MVKMKAVMSVHFGVGGNGPNRSDQLRLYNLGGSRRRCLTCRDSTIVRSDMSGFNEHWLDVLTGP